MTELVALSLLLAISLLLVSFFFLKDEAPNEYLPFLPLLFFFFFNDTATTEIYTLSLHDALPILHPGAGDRVRQHRGPAGRDDADDHAGGPSPAPLPRAPGRTRCRARAGRRGVGRRNSTARLGAPAIGRGRAGRGAVERRHRLVARPRGARARDRRPGVDPEAERELAGGVWVVETRLLDWVRGQSVADVPVAALLSGGIDSSLVVAAHARATGGATTTFNVRFPDRGYDETGPAVQVSRHYGTRHHTIDLGDWAMTSEALLELFQHFDQPFADTSLVPMYWISRAVREHGIICTLSGDGGDEAFGGYENFRRANLFALLMRSPDWMLGLAEGTARRATQWTRDWGRQAAKAIRLAHVGRANPAVLLAGLTNYLSEPQKEELVWPEGRAGLAPVYRHFETAGPRRPTDLEELSRRLTERCFSVSLPSDMLRKVDMMSMRASIEVRVPMLDEEVVALGVSLPHRLKTGARVGKRVLRALGRRWLPRAVARRPKQGFSIPLDVMVPRDFHRTLDDLLLAGDARTRPVLNGPLVHGWLAAFRDGRGRAGGWVSRGGLRQRVFTLLALELWLRQYRLAW